MDPEVKSEQHEGNGKPLETPTLPVHEIVGGSSVRQYLNQHVSQHLLEGLKKLSSEKPEDPLRWLGKYLLEEADRRDELANQAHENNPV